MKEDDLIIDDELLAEVSDVPVKEGEHDDAVRFWVERWKQLGCNLSEILEKIRSHHDENDRIWKDMSESNKENLDHVLNTAKDHYSCL